MKIIYITLFCFLFTVIILPQSGTAYHPMTANGAKNLTSWAVPLKWVNPSGVFSNDIYISFDSAKVAQLDSSVKYSKQAPLTDTIIFRTDQSVARYFWRVVEHYNSGSTASPIWYFTTREAGSVETKLDDFEWGTGNWIITGNQYCKWQTDDKRKYQLPAPAYNKVFAVRNTQQGIQNISTAVFSISMPQFSYYDVSLVITSDLKLVGQSLVAIEYSTDNGINWTQKYYSSFSQRDTNLMIHLFTNITPSPNIPLFLIRLKADLQDTASWWAIDRFAAFVRSGILTQPGLNITNVQENSNHQTVISYSNDLGSPTVDLYRKRGIPSDTGIYVFLKKISGAQGTLTYIDSTSWDSVYTYYTSLDGASPSNEATIYLTGITPVELSSFTAILEKGKVTLNWQTVTEKNNQGFHIERNDGIGWVNIEFVRGHSTTTIPNNYTYIDYPVKYGEYKYRLKQIDFDGTSKYSDEVNINYYNIIITYILEQNYPNPFNPNTSISYSLPSASNVKLIVYNSLGQTIKVLENGFKSAGNYFINFNAANLPSGIYFYNLEAGQFTQVKKMLLMK